MVAQPGEWDAACGGSSLYVRREDYDKLVNRFAEEQKKVVVARNERDEARTLFDNLKREMGEVAAILLANDRQASLEWARDITCSFEKGETVLSVDKEHLKSQLETLRGVREYAEQLKRDAERYRFLRADFLRAGEYAVARYDQIPSGVKRYLDMSLDDVIDAALKNPNPSGLRSAEASLTATGEASGPVGLGPTDYAKNMKEALPMIPGGQAAVDDVLFPRDPQAPKCVLGVGHHFGLKARVRAWRWDESETMLTALKAAGMNWMGNKGHRDMPGWIGSLRFRGLHGAQSVEAGDWIVEQDGQFWACDAETFTATYEPKSLDSQVNHQEKT